MKTDYYALVASLPYMPRKFDVERLPISRIRLQQRLSMLDPSDKEVVEQVQHFLHWDRQEPERSDADVEAEYSRLMESISNALVREMINHRIDVRTITFALRRRRIGLAPPASVGQYVEHIHKHWQHPNFLLERQQPWIPALRRSLDAKQPLGVERQLLQATWSRWVKLSEQHFFSFETVLLYLARWEIVDRWVRLDAARGRTRFDSLLTETLKSHATTGN